MSLGQNASRFSQASPSMMGNSRRGLQLADVPADATPDAEHAARFTHCELHANSPADAASSSTMHAHHSAPSASTTLPPSACGVDEVGAEEVTLDEVGAEEVTLDEPEDDGDEFGDDADEAIPEPPSECPSISHAIVPAKPPIVAAIVPHASSKPISLLAKMEQSMMAAHQARDTKSKAFNKAIKAAAKDAAKKKGQPPALLPMPSSAPTEPLPTPAADDGVLKRPASASSGPVKKRPAAARLESVSSVPGVSMVEVFDALKKKGKFLGVHSRRGHTTLQNDCARKQASMMTQPVRLLAIIMDWRACCMTS